VEELTREVNILRESAQNGDLDLYNNLNRHVIDRELLGPSRPPSILPEGDESHDAALLLNLKQGHDLSGARASPAGPHRKLGDQIITIDIIQMLFDEFFKNYHDFLPILDPEKDGPDATYEKSQVLFWTVNLVASRHFDKPLHRRLIQPYNNLIQQATSKPPKDHYIVKALCLICTWPPPVHSSTSDMTLVRCGIMTAIAKHFGLHHPAGVMNFSRERVQFREEDIIDRHKTWIACNIVDQEISTGYGQLPPSWHDIKPDSLLASNDGVDLVNLYARFEIEKLADRITRNIYVQQQKSSASHQESLGPTADIMSQQLEQLQQSMVMGTRKDTET
jgi:hypothetical protein